MGVRVAVVGAGPAGLCSAKHSQAAGMSCTVFEQSGAIGGTWQYTDCVGTDEYGIPVHTSMYRDLRINLPKEEVIFPGFPHKEKEESYISSEEMLEYIHDYADESNLRDLCKFYHRVQKVSLVGKEWKLTVKELSADREFTQCFDALFICNGLNNKPYTPFINGSEQFSGRSMHSHDYRVPEPFTGQRVLIIGGGGSALDLTNHISQCADKVFLSYHSEYIKTEGLRLRDNVVCKPDVNNLSEHSAQFKDGSVEDIDTLIYCTGYRSNYQILDESCGITEDDGFVHPLYKYFINANHPTMCILGNLGFCLQFPTFDLQVRFFIKTLTCDNILPGKDEMLAEVQERARKKLIDGAPKRAYFQTTADEDADYYNQLALMADIEPVPKVLTKIHALAVAKLFGNFPLFRKDSYRVIDDQNFTVSPQS